MAFKGADFLAVAHHLAQNSSDEGTARSSISRAYYAAFHGARDYCRATGWTVPTSNTHVEVRRCLERNNQHDIAAELRILHNWRNNADYEVPFPFSNLSSTTAGALRKAETILDRLSNLIP
jgi:uncharacterized protein (UPF0332 family)